MPLPLYFSVLSLADSGKATFTSPQRPSLESREFSRGGNQDDTNLTLFHGQFVQLTVNKTKKLKTANHIQPKYLTSTLMRGLSVKKTVSELRIIDKPCIFRLNNRLARWCYITHTCNTEKCIHIRLICVEEVLCFERNPHF